MSNKPDTQSKRHPIQPIEKDDQGVVRFKKNEIVVHLLDEGPFDLNDLAEMGFSREDWGQFAQLIGYSLSGFGDLGYVSDETYGSAERMYREGVSEREARIVHLYGVIDTVKKSVRDAAVTLFNIHPGDLNE